MASIRSSDTVPEKKLRSLLFNCGLRFRKNVKDLPGKPDIVFRSKKVAIFVNGDFWHGWRFSKWEGKLEKSYWHKKISTNKARDRRNYRKLRYMGWKVIIVWEHQLDKHPLAIMDKIEGIVNRNFDD